MAEKHATLSARQLWLIVAGIWTGIATVHYVQFYLQQITLGNRFLWLATLIEFVVDYYSWVPLAMGIVWLGRKRRFGSGRRMRDLLTHTLACFGVAFAHLAIVSLLLQLSKGSSFEGFTFVDFYKFVFLQLFHFEVLLYWVVLGLSFGFDHYLNSTTDGASAALGSSMMPVPRDKHLDTFLIKSNGHTVLLKTAQIDWLETADNYVNIHVGEEAHLLRERMHVLEARLHPQQFFRIHRSIMVNLARVKELRKTKQGSYVVVLRSGKTLQVSRRRREQLRRHLEKSAESSDYREPFRAGVTHA